MIDKPIDFVIDHMKFQRTNNLLKNKLPKRPSKIQINKTLFGPVV